MDTSPYLMLVLFFIPAILAIGTMFLLLKLQQKKNRRPPFTKDFLRSPGESLRKEMDELRDQMDDIFLGLIGFPALMLVLWLAFGKKMFWLFLFVAIVFVIHKLFQLIKVVNKKRIVRLGWEGERAIGEELNLLMLQGYRVFHDVPKEQRGNVDHVVIGPNGIFAVETKAISKDGNAKGADAVKIAFDGKQMAFPNGNKSTSALDQAKQHAAWLKKFLSSSTGESCGVTPVVLIPGWYINRTGPSKDVFVLSGGEITKTFSKLPGQRLDASQIQRIAHQLDQRCRSVEPWKPQFKKAS